MENIINGKLNGQTAIEYGYRIAQSERLNQYYKKNLTIYIPCHPLLDYERQKIKLSKLGIEFRLYFKEVDKHIQEYNNNFSD